MRRDHIHDSYTSFVLWFDHTLLQEGGAFTNTSGKLFKSNDKNLAGYDVYASPFKQWVYDSSIDGVTIPSGVTVNGTYTPRNSGLRLDFQNGRAIFDDLSSSAQVSGAYAVKDFNIYTTNRSDEELLFETAYMVNPSYEVAVTGLAAEKLVAPCVFLKVKGFNNVPLAFGGLDMSTVTFRAIILAASEFDLNGVANIFVDRQQSYMTVTSAIPPLNRFGDIKSGYYNYTESIAGAPDAALAYIENCSFSKLNQAAIYQKFPDLHIGFLDFKLELPRYPRG